MVIIFILKYAYLFTKYAYFQNKKKLQSKEIVLHLIVKDDKNDRKIIPCESSTIQAVESAKLPDKRFLDSECNLHLYFLVSKVAVCT